MMTDLKELVYQLTRTDIKRSDYKVVIVPASHPILKNKFYGFAKDNPKDKKIYVSAAIKDNDEREFIEAHEFAHKATDVPNKKVDEVVANLRAAVEEPEGFLKIMWRTLTDWDRIKAYFDTYVRKI